MTTWLAVWDIAGRRNNTMQGEDHLSDHAFAVLEKFVSQESEEATAKALGGVMWHPGIIVIPDD